ncbi:hypothetical protein [Leptospira interrogans]|uniref:hypothetical protein n=1 Tax=Leptospira interrogans TaxID=173 RepID=UPI0002BC557B|nr:hypothetical protein [Leptospira interrogans]
MEGITKREIGDSKRKDFGGREKMKLIYDFDEEDLAKKVRIEKEDGTCEYFPFYDFKFENSYSHTLRLKTWASEKERRKFYDFEPIVIN